MNKNIKILNKSNNNSSSYSNLNSAYNKKKVRNENSINKKDNSQENSNYHKLYSINTKSQNLLSIENLKKINLNKEALKNDDIKLRSTIDSKNNNFGSNSTLVLKKIKIRILFFIAKNIQNKKINLILFKEYFFGIFFLGLNSKKKKTFLRYIFTMKKNNFKSNNMQKENKINSQGEEKTVNRPFIYPIKMKKYSDTKNYKGENYFNNIRKKSFDSLELSPIEKKIESSQKYGNLEEIELKNYYLNKTNEISKRTVHIVMNTHDDYLKNLLYLLGERGLEYKYYFVYVKDGDKYFIQFSPKHPKKLSFNKLAPCTFLKPLYYEEFMALLNEKSIIDVKVALSNPFLVLKERGRPKNNEKINLNSYLIQYCYVLNIELYFNDLFKKEGEEEEEI